MYLIKTATFFIVSLALIGWGYHELQTVQMTEPRSSTATLSASKNENKGASITETYAAPAAAAAPPTWTETLSIVESASEVLQSVGFLNSPQQDIGDTTEPRSFNDNWNLSNTDLPSDVVFSYFETSEPEQIVYYTANGVNVIRPNQPGLTPQQEGQTLFVGTAEAVANTAEERQRRAEAANQNTAPEPGGKNATEVPIDGKEKTEEIELPENAFRVVFFKPGKRDNGSTLVAANSSPSSALQGPDYSFESAASDDEETRARVLSSVLSLGHGGEVMLKVAKNGYVRNKPGVDFGIFENAFRIAGLNLLFQEFAYIGVSDKPTPESFKWFDCKPQQQVLRGCIGAVPTMEGGDMFDLSDVGLERISYIWIKDTGKNKNFPSKWPTEGADLDAVRLYHAYRTQ